VLLNVALVTLLERKVLSIRQFRVGPNKVGVYGLTQPAADAIKLFSNGTTVLGPINGVMFILRPLAAIVLIILLCPLISYTSGHLVTRYSVFVLLIVLSLNVYPLLGSGWSSNRKYAYLGGVRAAAQTISYEISLAFILLCIVITWDTIAIGGMASKGLVRWLVLPLLVTLVPWMITVVAELNRTPFDFAEGESELVSGFNVEYGSEKFAIVFLAEYGMIYTFSFMTAFFFLNTYSLSCWRVAGIGIILRFVVIWLRTTLPRFRYDLLMLLSWKRLLPGSLASCQLMILLYGNL